jgi:serine/threonine-protein kinase
LIHSDGSIAGPLPDLCREMAAPEIVPEHQRIGPYRLIEKLGEGGMAMVFLAERDTAEFRQRVALKLMRSGTYSRGDQALFQREQRLHARLEHPHIARMLDSGISAMGVPYFAMEYVDGEPITDYCDARRLDLRSRLQLFALVCDAVQYAHQNLIVHRDLKPSNIFVSKDGAPKLLDFGIAKLLHGTTDGGFSADEPQTRTAVRRLTPGYAAPEQHAGEAITTATDVYALGILLHELLSGARPQIDKDGSVLPASARVAALPADKAAELAAARGLHATALARALRGDLDGVIGKALRMEPVRRYPGAQALADDVRRHLSGKPVHARPDSIAYRASKFVRRHRLGFASFAAVAVTLVAASVYSLQQARFARAQATRAEAEAARAQTEGARANAVKGFLRDLFNSAAPGATTAESADELLARGRERVDRDFAANPDLHAEILGMLGDLLRRRGHDEQAREPLEQAATLAHQQFGSDNARTLEAEFLLALQGEDTGHYRETAQRLQQALDAFHPRDKADAIVRIRPTSELGVLYQRSGDNDKAIALATEALTAARRLLPAGDPDALQVLANLGDVYKEAGRFTDAVPLLNEVLDSKRRLLGPQHAEVAEAMAQLASAKHKLGQYAEAEQLLRETAAIDAKAYSQPHHLAATHLNNLGVELALGGKLEEAIPFFDRSIDVLKKLYPEGHPAIAAGLTNVAMLHFRQGDFAQAEPAMRAGMAEGVRVRGERYPDYGYDENSLAGILLAEHKLDEAQSLLDDALADLRKRHGDKHVDVASVLVNQARLSSARGDHALALTRAREGTEMFAGLLPANHNRLTAARLVLGEQLYALAQYDEARTVFAAALANARASKSPVPVLIAHAAADAARVEAAAGQKGAAEQFRAQANAALEQVAPGPNAEREQVKQLLAAPSAAAVARSLP